MLSAPQLAAEVSINDFSSLRQILYGPKRNEADDKFTSASPSSTVDVKVHGRIGSFSFAGGMSAGCLLTVAMHFRFSFSVIFMLLSTAGDICFATRSVDEGIVGSSVVDASSSFPQNNINDNEVKNVATGVVPTSCPFVYEARVPAPEVGLINCTWYSGNSCCKRTEVTSVFSGMLALNTPPAMDPVEAKKCRNMLNYMMCYFCDPNQGLWYTTTVNICEDFCVNAYSTCSEAIYNDRTIGEMFANGGELCQAQGFKVMSGETNCFKFDPSVFDGGLALVPSMIVVFLGAVLPFLLSHPRLLLF